jgi:sugar-specific transcriptional regulator TrmB
MKERVHKPILATGVKRNYSLLRELGLSKTAVSCYQSLANNGPGKVSELADRLKLPRTGLYRVLDALHEQGFVDKTKLDGISTRYRAIPINLAAERYFKYQRRVIRPLLGGYEDFVASRRRPPL